MKHFLLLFFFCACALAQSQPRPASGGGVVNGQQLKDNDGNVFLDAGGHIVTSANWSILDDGSASFAGGDFTIDSNANISNVTSITANGISGFQLNNDGSASFGGGGFTVDNSGNVMGTLSVSGDIVFSLPTFDPATVGQLYQDPVTHAVFVSQGP